MLFVCGFGFLRRLLQVGHQRKITSIATSLLRARVPGDHRAVLYPAADGDLRHPLAILRCIALLLAAGHRHGLVFACALSISDCIYAARCVSSSSAWMMSAGAPTELFAW